LQENQEGNTAS